MKELYSQIKYLGQSSGQENYKLYNIRILHDKSRKIRGKDEWTHTISLFDKDLFLFGFEYTSNKKRIGNPTIAKAIEANETAQIWIIRRIFT